MIVTEINQKKWDNLGNAVLINGVHIPPKIILLLPVTHLPLLGKYGLREKPNSPPREAIIHSGHADSWRELYSDMT